MGKRKIDFSTRLYFVIRLLLSMSIPFIISYLGYDYLKTIESNDNCKLIKKNIRLFLTYYYLIVLIMIILLSVISLGGIFTI